MYVIDAMSTTALMQKLYLDRKEMRQKSAPWMLEVRHRTASQLYCSV